MVQVEVAVPDGCFVGSTFVVTSGDQELEVTVPEGCGPGTVLAVDLPDVPAAEEPPLEVEVPAGCAAGTAFLVALPDGREIEITVPDGCGPGMMLSVAVPPNDETAPPPAPPPKPPPPLPQKPPPPPPRYTSFGESSSSSSYSTGYSSFSGTGKAPAPPPPPIDEKKSVESGEWAPASSLFAMGPSEGFGKTAGDFHVGQLVQVRARPCKPCAMRLALMRPLSPRVGCAGDPLRWLVDIRKGDGIRRGRQHILGHDARGTEALCRARRSHRRHCRQPERRLVRAAISLFVARAGAAVPARQPAAASARTYGCRWGAGRSYLRTRWNTAVRRTRGRICEKSIMFRSRYFIHGSIMRAVPRSRFRHTALRFSSHINLSGEFRIPVHVVARRSRRLSCGVLLLRVARRGRQRGVPFGCCVVEPHL